nr:hypothetical protein [Tanacetum cinerariifolium]
MQKYTRFDSQSFKDAMIFNMDSIGKLMLEIILHQQRTSHLLKQKKLMQTQEDHSNPIPALNVDSLKVDSVVIQNTCFEKEESNSEAASSKSVKELTGNGKRRKIKVKPDKVKATKKIKSKEMKVEGLKVILPLESQRNTTNPLVAITDSLTTDYDLVDESSVCSTSLPPLKKLDGAEPVSGPKTIKSILKSKSTFKAKTLKGVKINEPSAAHAKGNKNSLASKVNSAPAEREINPRNPQHTFKRCKACVNSTHTTTDHYDIEWFKRDKALQAKKAKALKLTRLFSSFITIVIGGSSSIFTLFSLRAGDGLTFKAKEFLLPLVGAEYDSFILTPFQFSALNVDFDLKIDIIVFVSKINSTPFNFFNGGRGVLQTEDSFAESYSVAEELVTTTEGSVVFLCDSAGNILPVS